MAAWPENDEFTLRKTKKDLKLAYARQTGYDNYKSRTRGPGSRIKPCDQKVHIAWVVIRSLIKSDSCKTIETGFLVFQLHFYILLRKIWNRQASINMIGG